MDRYVGLDAHTQTCTLAVMGATGKRLTSRVVETNGHALREMVRGIPGRVHLCLEEGAQSAWLYEILEPEVAEILVAVPEESKGAEGRPAGRLGAGERTADGSDSHAGVQGSEAPDRASLRWQRLPDGDAGRGAGEEPTQVGVSQRGIPADSDLYVPGSRGKWLEQLPAGHRELADLLARELDALEPVREEAEARLLKEAKAHPITRKLATAPGMGPLRTAQLVAIVATPHRFRTSRQFWSYCGLSIVTRSSSDWVRDKHGQWVRALVQQTRGLTRKRQPVLKAIFKGAATTVLTQLVDHPLYADHQRRLQAGIKPNLAKLTLARRIAAIVLSMWKHSGAERRSRDGPRGGSLH